MFEDKAYSIFLTHRPRSIAFLVDLDAAPERLMNELADFSVDCWGGRHNLIVPVEGKRVYPDYWRLLQAGDPDLIYCYADIDVATVERLDWEVGPLHILRHRDLLIGGEQDFRVSIRDQASTRQQILRIRDSFAGYARRPEPSILTFNHDKRVSDVTSFVRRNFGVSRHAYFCVRDFGANPTYPNSHSDVDVLKCVAETQNLVLPMHVCGHAPLWQQAVAGHRSSEFLICFGDSPWNFVHYWNSSHFYGPTSLWNMGIDHLWLPTAVLANKDEYQALIRLIARRVWTYSNQRELRVVSYDHDVGELDDIAKRIWRDSRTNLYPGRVERLNRGEFPECSPRRPIEIRPKLPQHEHVRGKSVFVEVERPEAVDADGDEAWMVDLKIQDPYQEKLFVNADLWWKLPKRGYLGHSFAGSRPSRVGIGGMLSLEVRAREQSVEFSIPANRDLFGRLLLPESSYTTVDDLRHPIARRYRQDICLSDKGRYLSGVLGLFGSLREAAYMFEHPFWRGIFERLCCPPISEQVPSKAEKDIVKGADEFIKEYQADRHTAVAWLKELVVKAGQHIPRGENPLRYEDIKKSYDKYVESLTPGGGKELASREDPKATISDLTREGVLLQGAKVRCGHCMSQFWYHVDDMARTITCTGCRKPVPLPAETEWTYKPNELLRSGIRYQGLTPVIRTLGRLFENARACFIFLSGVNLYEYKHDEPVVTGEVDICWMKDGEFGIAEVKKSTKGFATSDYDKLVRVALIARPNKVLLAAIEGDDQKLERGRQYMLQSLKPIGIEVEVWGPTIFSVPPIHII